MVPWLHNQDLVLPFGHNGTTILEWIMDALFYRIADLTNWQTWYVTWTKDLHYDAWKYTVKNLMKIFCEYAIM